MAYMSNKIKINLFTLGKDPTNRTNANAVVAHGSVPGYIALSKDPLNSNPTTGYITINDNNPIVMSLFNPPFGIENLVFLVKISIANNTPTTINTVPWISLCGEENSVQLIRKKIIPIQRLQNAKYAFTSIFAFIDSP